MGYELFRLANTFAKRDVSRTPGKLRECRWGCEASALPFKPALRMARERVKSAISRASDLHFNDFSATLQDEKNTFCSECGDTWSAPAGAVRRSVEHDMMADVWNAMEFPAAAARFGPGPPAGDPMPPARGGGRGRASGATN